MAGGLLFVDLALIDEGLHPGVVVGQPVQLVVAQQIAAGIADVHQTQLGAGEEATAHRGAHAVKGGVPVDQVGELVVGPAHRTGQRGEHLFSLEASVGRCHMRDGHGRGQIAGRRATHAVGDHERRG